MMLEEVFAGHIEEAAELISRYGLDISGDAYNYKRDMSRSFAAYTRLSIQRDVVTCRIGQVDPIDKEEFQKLSKSLGKLNLSCFLLQKYRTERKKEYAVNGDFN